ncbi:MAG: BlaI/MecI/CopY family transcriptional regulator [Clostridia bacterium]|nr:BlaI/MecI/CopY family transcriptional regulator [Clostridia bacterium]
MNVENVDALVKDLLEKAGPVDHSVRLPDAEFDVMDAIWGGNPPLTTSYLMQKIGHKKGWKAPTLISFLVRLEERGFITSFKNGKERYYVPVADREEYVRLVTESFIERYHHSSFVSVLNSLYKDKGLDEKDIDEFLEWLKSRY